MNAFVILSGIVFAVVAVVHAARLFYGWPVRIGSASIPGWVSWLGVAGSGALAVWAWHLAAL
ncbi:MAG: hypothetical protein ACLPL5_05830 [Stellaceae bacterium]|jgi:hypothetical protein